MTCVSCHAAGASSKQSTAGKLQRDLNQRANAVVDQAGGGRLSQPQEAADGENLL
jgi:hypothetical protein